MNLNLARCVRYTFDDRCLAIRQYVRTEDVMHLVGPIHLHAQYEGHNLTCGVAWWMQNAFKTSRLRYMADPDHCDLWSRPSVTLYRGGGDCDDLAITTGTLCRAVGLYVEFVVGMLRERGVDRGVHVWVEGLDEYGFFLIEPTTGCHYRERTADYDPWYFLTPERCVLARERGAARRS